MPGNNVLILPASVHKPIITKKNEMEIRQMRKKISHMHLKQYLYILVFAVVSWDFLGEGREEAGKTSFAMDSAFER